MKGATCGIARLAGFVGVVSYYLTVKYRLWGEAK